MALALALTFAVPVAADAGATTSCGTVVARLPSGKHGPVAVRVVSGAVPCDRARRILKAYLGSRRPNATAGWLCGAGFHGRRDIAACYSSRNAASIAASRPR